MKRVISSDDMVDSIERGDRAEQELSNLRSTEEGRYIYDGYVDWDYTNPKDTYMIYDVRENCAVIVPRIAVSDFNILEGLVSYEEKHVSTVFYYDAIGNLLYIKLIHNFTVEVPGYTFNVNRFI